RPTSPVRSPSGPGPTSPRPSSRSGSAGGSTPGTSGPPTARLRLASPAQPADKLVRATRGGVAQPGRALPSHGRGRRFKSAHLHSPKTQALLGFSVFLGDTRHPGLSISRHL